MTTGATGQLGLALPVQGELSGTWGDTVNNGITQYTNIAIAGTLTLTGDGAVTLANTTGDASASNITSTLSGAGTVTAQFAIVRVSGTTTTKVVTGPSYSKTYVVDNASSYAVTFKASGQTGVSIAAAEKVTVVFNGTDYIKLAGTIANAAGSNTQIQFNNGGLFGASANLTWDGTTLSSTQINITGQGTLRLQDTTGGEYVGLRAPASLGASYTLTWPADDGTSGQALITDGSGTLSWSSAASGDVYGPASATDNAVSRFDGTTGKLIQDSVVIISDTGAVTGVTDLTASGTVTISGGTANGVTYLNGSKVLTSGSALTFNGTNALTVTANSAELYLAGGSSAAQGGFLSISRGGTAKILLGTASNVLGGGSNTSDDLTLFATAESRFYASSAEGMRLTSTGLGIGTSSPSQKLSVVSSAGTPASFTSTGSNVFLALTNSGATTYVGNDSTSGSFIIQTPASSYSTKLTLDNAGNLGLGVTPSAWSGGKAFEIGAQGNSLWSYNGNAGDIRLLANAYWNNSNYIYSTTAPAASYQVVSGAHYWQIASSGTAGTNVSFTQAMTLDASGNLGLGTTSPTGFGTSYTVLDVYNGTVGGYILARSPNVTGQVSVDNNTAMYVQTRTNHPIVFSLNNTERARIDSSGNLGIGTSSPQDTLDITRAAGTTAIRIASQGVGSLTWRLASQLVGVTNAGFVIRDETNGVNRLAIDGVGNVGIGTSSPTDILTLAGGASGSYGLTINNAKEGGGTKALFQYDRDNALAVVGANTTNGLVFKTLTSGSLTTKATLDSAGNLGLGVTPSAWASNYTALQVKNASIYGFSSYESAYSVNAYYNGSWKYISSTNASRYDQVSGVHSWHIAPSGTAGNAISFTQAMMLDVDGDLGIGTTSPAVRLNVTDSADGGNSGTIRLGSDATYYAQHQFRYNSSEYRFGTYGAGQFMSLYTAGSERARIDSSGYLYIRTTTRRSSAVVSIDSTTGTTNGMGINASGTASSGMIFFSNPNGDVGSISIDGSATTYATSSDYRLKHDIQPMTGALAKVAQLKPVTYKWNADNSDGEGFIAHELAEICPHAVTGEKDAVDADGKPVYQGIDTSFLVATLTAAIQEQQAIIESLKARLDAANL